MTSHIKVDFNNSGNTAAVEYWNAQYGSVVGQNSAFLYANKGDTFRARRNNASQDSAPYAVDVEITNPNGASTLTHTGRDGAVKATYSYASGTDNKNVTNVEVGDTLTLG
jgi:hypothetical protein